MCTRLISDNLLKTFPRVEHRPFDYEKDFSIEVKSLLESVRSLKEDSTSDISHFKRAITTTENIRVSPIDYSSIENKLFESSANAKIKISSVSMYMSSAQRNSLYKQLDLLHDVNSWCEEDALMSQESFDTFLRAILSIKPDKYPRLALTSSGRLVAGWHDGLNTLSIEFFPHDKVRWILARASDDEIDLSSSESSVKRIKEQLEPYHPEVWFNNAET